MINIGARQRIVKIIARPIFYDGIVNIIIPIEVKLNLYNCVIPSSDREYAKKSEEHARNCQIIHNQDFKNGIITNLS